MRYVVLVAMSLLGTLFSGSVFSVFTINGIQIDIVFLLVMSLVLVEKSAMPVVFAAVTGLLMDIMYARELGIYALSYAIAAAVGSILLRKVEKFNFLHLFAIGAVGYIFKEVVTAFIVFVQGARFNFPLLFGVEILPAAAVNGALLLVAYLLIARLYRNAWMRPRASAHHLDEL